MVCALLTERKKIVLIRLKYPGIIAMDSGEAQKKRGSYKGCSYSNKAVC